MESDERESRSWVNETYFEENIPNPENKNPESKGIWIHVDDVDDSPSGSFRQIDDDSGRRTRKKKKKTKKEIQVFLEGYVESPNEEELGRTKSLTEEDLDELKGCLDLGFGFSYDEIPELCGTLPALELCYSMSQRFLDDHQKSPPDSSFPPSAMAVSDCSSSPASGTLANWKISSPGDHPEDVKARLKFWAQAVACTLKLCS